MLRLASLICVLVAGVCLAWAGYLALAPTPDRHGPVVVEDADRDLGNHPVGESAIAFRVHNPSSEPVELLNGQGGCAPNCCFYPKGQERRPIAPGETVEFVGELHVREPGPFEYKGDLYLNENGLRIVKLTIRGVGVAPEGQTNAPPKP